MPTVEQIVETPAQMVTRLEKMGEERVRYLLSSAYFDPRKEPLVRGWLTDKDRERGTGPSAEQDQTDRALSDLQGAIRQVEAAASRSAAAVESARVAQVKSMQVTRIALILGSLAIVVSIVALLLK